MSSIIINESTICKAFTVLGKPCKYKCKTRGYCNVHSKIYKFDKPEECSVCFESSSDIHHPLECSHWVHVKCIKKWGKNTCPLCKKKLDKIKIKIPKENRNISITPTFISENHLHMIQEFLTSFGYPLNLTEYTTHIVEVHNIRHVLDI